MKNKNQPDVPFIAESDPAIFSSRLAKKVDNKMIEIEGEKYYGTIEGDVAWAYFLPTEVRKSIYSKMTPKEMEMTLWMTNPIILVPTSIVKENREYLDSYLFEGLKKSTVSICDKTIIFICPDDEAPGDGPINFLYSELLPNEQNDFFLSYFAGGDFYDPDSSFSMDKHVSIRSLLIESGIKPLYEAMKRHPYLFNKWMNKPVCLALKAFTVDALPHDEKFFLEASSFFKDLLSVSFTGTVTFFLYCYLVGGLHETAFDSPELPYSPEVKKMARGVWLFEMKDQKAPLPKIPAAHLA